MGFGSRCSPDASIILAFIDSTINRAHPCAGGSGGSNAEDVALGRSKGGFSTKIHAADALGLGNPLECVLTGRQAGDIGQAETLLALTPAGACAFVGDNGYDSDALIQAIVARDMKAVIPPRCN